MGAESRAKVAEFNAAKQIVDERLKAAIPFEQHQLFDAYGKPIMMGATYGLSSSLPIPATVVDISQNLHPSAPPGSYRVVLMAQITMPAMSRSPLRGLIYIGGPANETPAEDNSTPPPAEPSGIVLTD